MTDEECLLCQQRIDIEEESHVESVNYGVFWHVPCFEMYKEGRGKITQHNDMITRTENVIEHGEDSLCERCSGTGNEIYGMFSCCDDCNGKGVQGGGEG